MQFLQSRLSVDNLGGGYHVTGRPDLSKFVHFETPTSRVRCCLLFIPYERLCLLLFQRQIFQFLVTRRV